MKHDSGWAASAVALCSLLVLIWWIRRYRTARRRATFLAECAAITAAYIDVLSIKQKQLVRFDDYDNPIFDAWYKHIGYFVDNVIKRDIAADAYPQTLLSDGLLWNTVKTQVLESVEHHQSCHPQISRTSVRSGLDYEILCKDILEGCGWSVEKTAATGDQGADLIARRDGLRVVIQCKLYSKPVGNKAVQEASSGLRFYGGTCAAVVSNAPFTRSALQLAQISRVHLLHHDQLPELYALALDD